MALLLPTHFFYAFLYYTDVGGVTFVLSCYLVSPPAVLQAMFLGIVTEFVYSGWQQCRAHHSGPSALHMSDTRGHTPSSSPESAVLPAPQASLCNRHHLSAALGAAAILFRQTNAVWVAFVLGAAVLRMVAPDAPGLAQAPVERQLLQVLRSAWLVSVLVAARQCHACAVHTTCPRRSSCAVP